MMLSWYSMTRAIDLILEIASCSNFREKNFSNNLLIPHYKNVRTIPVVIKYPNSSFVPTPSRSTMCGCILLIVPPRF